MANVFTKFIKGILLKPEASDLSDNLEGSFWHNSTAKMLKGYFDSAVRTFVTTDQIQSLSNKTIDADSNTISNLAHGSEVDSPSSGVHGVSGSVVGTSDGQILTNKTIDADSNTISNLAHGSEVDNPSSGVHGVVGSVVGTSDNQILTTKTIDADNNTISNLEVDNLKSGVLDTDLSSVSASDDTIPSAKATKAYADTKCPEPTGNGIVVRTAADTATNVSIAGTSSEIDVANADGTGGNPTIGISDNPVIPGTGSMKVPVGTIAQRSGSPAAGMMRYNSDTAKFEGYYAAAWKELGSSVGSINYITNSDLEAAVTGFSAYADADQATPEDGTGAGATLTVTRNTSSPIRGIGDLLLTKDAASRRGEGCSIDFEIDDADFASVIEISFDYKTSANYADDDIGIFIYDTDASSLIYVTPQNLKATAQGGHFKGYFQSHVSNDSYRLIFHIASTNANAYTVNVDNVRVGPAIRNFGSVITDWKTWTPTGSWTANSPVYTGLWRRIGDVAEYQVKIVLSGAPDNAALTINLPHTIDTNKMLMIAVNGILGQALLLDSGTMAYYGRVIYNSTTTVRVYAENAGGSYVAGNDLSTSVTHTWANTDILDLKFSVPILGWSSSCQMSDDADTRVVAAKYETANSDSITNNSEERVCYDTKIFDTHNAVSFTNFAGQDWKFTAPISGYYKITANHSLNASAGWSGTEFYSLRIYKNNVQTVERFYYPTTANVENTISISDLVSLNKNDYIDVRAFQLSGGDINQLNSSLRNFVLIERISGPSAICPNESICINYTSNNAQSIANDSTQIVKYEDKVYDTHGAYDTSTGIFTAPASGKYHIDAGAHLDGATGWELGEEYYIFIYKNGSANKVIRKMIETSDASAASLGKPMLISGDVELNKGETADIRVYQNSDGAIVLVNNGVYNWISIHRIGF